MEGGDEMERGVSGNYMYDAFHHISPCVYPFLFSCSSCHLIVDLSSENHPRQRQCSSTKSCLCVFVCPHASVCVTLLDQRIIGI